MVWLCLVTFEWQDADAYWEKRNDAANMIRLNIEKMLAKYKRNDARLRNIPDFNDRAEVSSAMRKAQAVPNTFCVLTLQEYADTLRLKLPEPDFLNLLPRTPPVNDEPQEYEQRFPPLGADATQLELVVARPAEHVRRHYVLPIDSATYRPYRSILRRDPESHTVRYYDAHGNVLRQPFVPHNRTAPPRLEAARSTARPVTELPPHERLLVAPREPRELYTNAHRFLFQRLDPQFTFHAPLFESSWQAFDTAFYFYRQHNPPAFQDMQERPNVYLHLLSDPYLYVATDGTQDEAMGHYFETIFQNAQQFDWFH